MFKRYCCIMVLMLLFVNLATAQAGCPLEPRLQPFGAGRVIVFSLNVRDIPSTGDNSNVVGQLSRDDKFTINGSGQCSEGMYWYLITTVGRESALEGYIAEGANGEYLVEPMVIPPTLSPVFEFPALSTPVPPVTEIPLPPVEFITEAEAPTTEFLTWNWSDDLTFFGGDEALPDPFTIVPPDVYAGDMPALPIDLSSVAFVTDTGLSTEGLALLSQNGFVVSPRGAEQFDEAYSAEGWSPYDGYSVFVTTDGVLHSFYLVFENLLTYLEQESLYPEINNLVARAYTAAEAQAVEAEGTALEDAAHAAALYYAVPLVLLNPPAGETVILNPFGGSPVEVSTLPGVVQLIDTIAAADPAILEEAQTLVDLIVAAEGQGEIPFLVDTIEDFGIYRPRGHYTISPLYERYFRAVTWLGRITFRAAEATETQAAALALRALQSDPAALESRQNVSDALEFLIGPVDNLGPEDYAPLAEDIFGADLSLDAIADPDLLAEFQAQLEQLPPPAINTAVLPEGAMAEQLDEIGRGFRLLGQRFTIDANILQQVIDPLILMRTLPTALDVPAALGSDTAYVLSQQAGASNFPTYDTQMTMLREEASDLSAQDWLANIYSGWLWALQPFWVRNAESYPPLMNTDAWARHDLHTGLSSYTELKHATILYTAQPMGGRGGGGELPLTYGYVEPNPLVFARVAIISESLYQGLLDRGLVQPNENYQQQTYLSFTHQILRQVTTLSTYLADVARRELNGEGLTREDHDFIQYGYAGTLSGIRSDIQMLQDGPPKPAALVTDIASNGVTGEALQVAVGGVDYIYVVIPTPNGLQVARGGVYSYYEFVNQGGQRMTDEEWRAQVADGSVPPRPEWVETFMAE